jgi:hypothetical protein
MANQHGDFVWYELLRRHAETTETFECRAAGVDFDLR